MNTKEIEKTPWMTRREVSNYLHKSLGFVDKLTRTGVLTRYGIPNPGSTRRIILFKRSDVESLICPIGQEDQK